MPTFSIAIIARDEAGTLPTLLGSLAAFLDGGGDVLVMDTGSGDDTIEVARRFGCRVHAAGDSFGTRLAATDAHAIQSRFSRGGEGPLATPGQHLFDFARARQAAGMRASSDFVWQPDASDEVLALDLAPIERRIAERPASALSNRLILGAGSLEAVRFYDRRWLGWEGRTHEALWALPRHQAAQVPSVAHCPESELLVTHHRQHKERNYIAGLALDAIAHPTVSRWMHYLGRELHYNGWHQSALAALEEHAAMTQAPDLERAQSLSLAGECLEALDRVDEAMIAYAHSAVLDRNRREPLLRLAQLRSRLGDFDGAADCCEKALTIERRSPGPETDANYTWAPHAILYWSLFWLGRRDAARHHWNLCRQLSPPGMHTAHARLFGNEPVAVAESRP